MSTASRDRDRAALDVELRRASETAVALASDGARPPWGDLLDALRRVPELLDELDASRNRAELLEKQCDELSDRLIAMEFALRSTNAARDDAVLLLAEIREIATGEAGGGPTRDVLEAVRRLRDESGQGGTPAEEGSRDDEG